ncbi:hypothetical protein [Salipiger mucosus]|uniref:Lipopolysaccharide export system protein LptC n=1 Tax=Salipiger mucosus DSM 16094 TaxID=1123237 RepID=S9QLI2_9RHOB|nr:hypothetical protein [Salipiger mucosus]EPX82331.1 hypothetical protein Salmuc_04056 [Salipiger mucosus DSM 16094]
MARGGDTYSSIIAWLKILLPMAALAMLSTLFLLPRGGDPMDNMPIGGSLPEDGGPSEQVTAPYYTGTTESGDALTMTARAARPLADGEGDLAAEAMTAQLDLADGSRITLEAARATLDDSDASALLENGVVIESSTGYVMRSDSMRTALDRIEADTLGPVSGSGPAGEFTAGRLRITSGEKEGDVQLLFTDGVNLVYEPEKQ